MFRTTKLTLAIILAFGLFTSLAAAQPEEKVAKASTTITIPGMHCAGCAKKVATKLVQVEGVARAKVDMKTKTIRVTPKKDTTVSPKALWEAVEASAEVPTRVKGPSGTFTKKPKE